jgi:hypothetical protein
MEIDETGHAPPEHGRHEVTAGPGVALRLVRAQDVTDVVGEARDLELEVLREGDGEEAGALQRVLEERDRLTVRVGTVHRGLEHGQDVIDVTRRVHPTIHSDSGSSWYEHPPATR